MQPEQPYTPPTQPIQPTPPVSPVAPAQPAVPPQPAPTAVPPAPFQAPGATPQPAPKKSKKKLWIIAVGVALVAILVAALVFIVPGLTVSKDQYAQAATESQTVYDASEQYATAVQEYLALGGKLASKDTLAAAKEKTDSQYAKLKEATATLAESPALRDNEVKLSYNAYFSKAEKFNEIAAGYDTALPLYVAMTDTCKRINVVDMTNLFQQLDLAVDALTVANKEQAIKLMTDRFGDCLEASTELRSSGSSALAQVGGVYETMINQIYTNYRTQFDEFETLGANASRANYAAAGQKLKVETTEKLKTIVEKQNSDAKEGDYTKEIESLEALLKKKAA